MKNPEWGHLLFEVQRIEMVRDKNKDMKLIIRGTDRTQVCEKQVHVRDYRAQLEVLVEWILKEEGKITVQLGDCISTIDLNEVENRLLVIEPLNIKARGVL